MQRSIRRKAESQSDPDCHIKCVEPFNNLYAFENYGERGRNRTYNLVIKSHLLCQLSYAPAIVGISGETRHPHYTIPARRARTHSGSRCTASIEKAGAQIAKYSALPAPVSRTEPTVPYEQ